MFKQILMPANNFENIWDNQTQRDMNTLQADELGMKQGDGAETLECRLLVWLVSSFIVLCTSFCSSYPCITLMLLHRELELSMLSKCSRISGLSLSTFHLTFVFVALFLQAKRDPRGTSIHELTQKKCQCSLLICLQLGNNEQFV